MAGVPVPLVDLRIRGDDGTRAPWDGKSDGRDPGARPVHHRQLPRGAGRRAEKFTADGWLRTGDVATMDELGFVRITDRTKDLIKSGGEWISSVDLENALMAHPAVAEAAVIAIPDEKWSERPLACVVLKPGQAIEPAARASSTTHLLQARLRQVAAAGALRVHRRGAAHLDRQVLEAEAARALSALKPVQRGTPLAKKRSTEFDLDNNAAELRRARRLSDRAHALLR